MEDPLTEMGVFCFGDELFLEFRRIYKRLSKAITAASPLSIMAEKQQRSMLTFLGHPKASSQSVSLKPSSKIAKAQQGHGGPKHVQLYLDLGQVKA
jgi:hypothetical protein